MLANTPTTVLFAVVALGVTLQLVALSRLGARIVRGKVGRCQCSLVRGNPAPAAMPVRRPAIRRRRRDYRLALHLAQPTAK